MRLIYIIVWKFLKKLEFWIFWNYSNTIAHSSLKRQNIKHGKCTFLGTVHIRVHPKGNLVIGDNFLCQSGALASIDTSIESKIQVEENGTLLIGNNVGMSSTIIHVWNRVEIQDFVKIGAGCIIFDTNFHSTDAAIRKTIEDQKHATTEPIIIKENAFIGTRSIITKGVSIGVNSIVAAGSVVVKNIPDNEIWGGNPAKFIKRL